MIGRIKEKIAKMILPKKRILIVSIQKCGTHLIKKVMDEIGLKGVGVGKDCKLSDFYRLKNNQYLWSHYAPSDELCMDLEKDNMSVYIILNIRDPRDALVSWFYWLHSKNNKVTHLHREYMKRVYRSFTDEELIRLFIKIDKFRECEYNILEQFRFVRFLFFHPKVLKVRYEDLIGPNGGGNCKSQIKTLNDIFNYLEIYNANTISIANKIFDINSETFRKGEIDGYKKELSKNQIELFNKLHGDIITQFNYELDN